MFKDVKYLHFSLFSFFKYLFSKSLILLWLYEPKFDGESVNGELTGLMYVDT